MTVGDLGERRMISLFTAAAAGRERSDIVIGSGDDAAVFDAAGPTVVSTDTAVQGRHFRFDWSTPTQIGARVVVQSAADIAAMGGRTVGIVVSIACPADSPAATIADINAGIVAAAHRLDARVLGGDLVQASTVVLTVTSLGALDGLTPVALGGARPGDVLAVSGPLGAGAAGLEVLRHGENIPEPARAALLARHTEVVDAYRLPNPDLGQGVYAARAGAHAMTDISDGLVEELITLAAASGVRLSIRSAAVPRTAATACAAHALGADERHWVLTGGEDHQLLASFDPADVPPGWTVIGDVQHADDRAGEVIVDGTVLTGLAGWQSFGHR
ncbi:MAG: thiamine-phosphate kinase [Gordonia sp. (in: high G+C Gram-positive bacteria)]